MRPLIPSFLAKRSGTLEPAAEQQIIDHHVQPEDQGPAAPESPVQGFRERAAECQRRAQDAKRPDIKERWLLVAENWTRLAQHAEAFRAALRERHEVKRINQASLPSLTSR
jgi:hypothetical protein